ncbi:MAG: YifB family Mg chelatase-like AAA ATPase [Pseudomonadota bacterium]
MFVSVKSATLHGVDALEIDVEVDFTQKANPAFTMVGLAEGAVREARERVLAAVRSSMHRLPAARITVNLAPADRRKAGSGFDLPLALGLLAGAGIIPPERLEGLLCAGELSLAGELRAVTGILPMAVLARDQKMRALMVPAGNGQEAAMVDGLTVYGPRTLNEAVAIIMGDEAAIAPVVADVWTDNEVYSGLDFIDVKGQEHGKRAIEIAAAGAHNLLFIGPPGSGKTMLAQRIPSVLPHLTPDESLEVTKIYSVAGLLEGGAALMRERPFRSPHHTVSEAGLVGGGTRPRPGEVSLAHRGVLFLDELPEFNKSALEVLRQPLEDSVVTISRAIQTLTYPANCMLVAAMNPCPCGYRTDDRHTCICTTTQIQRYRSRLSGPLLDRIDLHIEVPAVPWEDLRSARSGTSSATMRERVMAARARQSARYAGTNITTNAELTGSMLEKHCALGTTEHDFLERAVKVLALSARAYTRIIRIARTIADLEAADNISVEHLAEAVNCRTLDREHF